MASEIEMQADIVNAIRGLIRAELRRCELRPPAPSGPGAWRWDPERDEWIALLEPEEVASEQ